MAAGFFFVWRAFILRYGAMLQRVLPLENTQQMDFSSVFNVPDPQNIFELM